MPSSGEPVNLAEAYVHLRPFGAGEALPKETGHTERMGANLVFDPTTEGLLIGEAEMTTSSRHRGERHLDGDEFVYLVSGAIRVALEGEDGTTADTPLIPGEALIVLQGTWHRLLVDGPSRILFISTGRTEVRPPA